MNLNSLNQLSPKEATEELVRCCGASRWVDQMVRRRPFRSTEQIYQIAEEIWNELDTEDWLEAFSHHPRIGDVEALKSRFASTQNWASDEQKGALGVSEAVLSELALENKAYEKKFGFIFLICATGKKAEEMLDALKVRMMNPPSMEIQVASQEQSKIMKLRLRKLLESMS